MASMDDIRTVLRDHRLRVTAARVGVYATLERTTCPTTAADIMHALKEEGISVDLVTVYRALDALERSGLVSKSDRMKEGWRYVTRAAQHTHVIVCTVCGTSMPIASCELERFERTISRSTGFTDIRHTLQFQGRCPDCSRASGFSD